MHLLEWKVIFKVSYHGYIDVWAIFYIGNVLHLFQTWHLSTTCTLDNTPNPHLIILPLHLQVDRIQVKYTLLLCMICIAIHCNFSVFIFWFRTEEIRLGNEWLVIIRFGAEVCIHNRPAAHEVFSEKIVYTDQKMIKCECTGPIFQN